KRPLIVAESALKYITFETLVKNGEGQDYASLNYLVKTNEVVYTPSASVIAAIRQSGTSPTDREGSRKILLVADPVFNSNDPRLKGVAATQNTGESRGLGLDLESDVNEISGEQRG